MKKKKKVTDKKDSFKSDTYIYTHITASILELNIHRYHIQNHTRSYCKTRLVASVSLSQTTPLHSHNLKENFVHHSQVSSFHSLEVGANT